MKHTLLYIIFSLFLLAGHSQSYSVASIPEELKKNAAVVTLLDNTNVDVEDVDKASVKTQKIFTILNEEGKGALIFSQYCNKYVSLDDAEIKMYDKNGKQIARIKKKELFNTAIGEGLIEDGYMSYYRLSTATYPVTVEYNYEIKLKSILNLPTFQLIGSKEAVVESNYSIKGPADINIRYKAKFTSITPQVTDEGKYKIYKWTVKNLPAVEDEDGSASGDSKFPHVDIAADQFSYYGNRGDQSSWKNFGAWISSLYDGLDELPADRQQFFRDLVKDAPNDVEKARRIYNYLQQNFRYVSIQLGIGGLKPFSASFTDQKKYGDCKALSNYMRSALKAVGVKSYVAIINAEYDAEPVDADFPSNQFNHVIVCVPQPKDSIWLECTSSTTEFNSLGTFTENRNALLITGDGGVLVPTPKSKSSENILATRTTVVMADDLSGLTETAVNSTGEYRELIADKLKEKRDDQKEFIVQGMGYKEPDDFLFESAPGSNESHTRLKMVLRKVTEFTAGDKYFLNPRINKLVSRPLPTATDRKLDFYFRFPFENRDTTVIKLPADFHVDVLPKEKTLSTDYSFYQSKYWYDEKENAVYTYTSLVLNKHKIAAKDYSTVKNFFDEVIKDDAQRVVVKKTGATNTEKKAF
ncbi:MAG: transglutaminase-like domain-containing protein [Flavisolibacter sp.]